MKGEHPADWTCSLPTMSERSAEHLYAEMGTDAEESLDRMSNRERLERRGRDRDEAQQEMDPR